MEKEGNFKSYLLLFFFNCLLLFQFPLFLITIEFILIKFQILLKIINFLIMFKSILTKFFPFILLVAFIFLVFFLIFSTLHEMQILIYLNTHH